MGRFLGLISAFLLSLLHQFSPRSQGTRVLLNALIVKNQSVPAASRQTQEGSDVGAGICGPLIKFNSPSGPGKGHGGGRGDLLERAGRTSGEANTVSEKEECYLTKENN